MKHRTRIALLCCGLALACNAPDSTLFSPVSDSAGGSGGGAGSAASGAVNAGGSSVLGGQANGAAPSAGSAGSAGTGPQTGDGGANAEPTGMGGMADGMGGQPPEPDPPEPVCGNGKREGTEECDDMGHEGEDGCNANCEVVCSHFGEDAVKSADNHCYQGYDEADFVGAQEDCIERGAHLVTISSADENEIAAGFIDNSKFIGAFEMIDAMDDSAGSYEWVTGEPFAYENWEEDQPDRDWARCNGTYSGDYCYSHCAVIANDGTWNDTLCDIEDGYICEWEPAGE